MADYLSNCRNGVSVVMVKGGVVCLMGLRVEVIIWLLLVDKYGGRGCYLFR